MKNFLQNILKKKENNPDATPKKDEGEKQSSSRILDKLLETLDKDDNFLTED